MEKKNKKSFEKNIARLQEISELLEDENIGLEKAISLYEEGVTLSRLCIDELKKAELKITKIRASVNDIEALKESDDIFNGDNER